MTVYFLTRRTALDLQDVYSYSVAEWGPEVADTYIHDLYEVFAAIAARPQLGEAHRHRAFPFLMVPARRHFVVYDRFDDEAIIIVTLLHQVRDIEQVLSSLAPALAKEIASLKADACARPREIVPSKSWRPPLRTPRKLGC